MQTQVNGAILINCKWKYMKIQEVNIIDSHKDCVNSVCFSPDGTTLASCSGNPYIGSNDNSIRLWDVKTGQLKCKLDGHEGSVKSVCFSPDGNTLASGSADKSICLWDVRSTKKIAKLNGHTKTVNSVCFSPDGNTLASGSYDNSICLWDVKRGQQKSKLDVCFSGDGNTLASGSDDNSIHLWDDTTGKEIQYSDKSYKDILEKFKTPLCQNNPLPENISTHITIPLISKQAIFQAQGTLILKGEFMNQSGIDLKTLFKQKGSCILENQLELRQK